MYLKTWLSLSLALFIGSVSFAATPVQAPAPSVEPTKYEPIKSINIYVEPYYRSQSTVQGVPQVNVGTAYDALLRSTKADDILKVRDSVVAKPEHVTPMAMMVLSIRLYDVGLRDDALFWFYVAKERFVVMANVLDTNVPGLVDVVAAMRSFSELMGPTLNGYGLCNVESQIKIHADAVKWVENFPYAVMFNPQLTARGPDRQALHSIVVQAMNDNLLKEQAYLKDSATMSQMQTFRVQNHANEMLCWK